jgi:2-polyprenyl-3-methyl-5-hydroxy-6-metoxy-1,4-benzoquinol methylase
MLNVQAVYRWNLRRLDLGFTLDVGCGLGRNLYALRGVGVDHNVEAVAVTRARGFTAFTPEEFVVSDHAEPGRFDSMLLAHVVEHMTRQEAHDLIAAYTPFVRSGGRVVLITPQEAGFRSDPTHVEFIDHAVLGELLAANGARVERAYSFPFPRPVGKVLRYNEFVAVGRLG